MRASTPSGGRSPSATVEGDLINRCEMFGETDLDAALASSTSSAGRRRGWKTRQAEFRPLRDVFAARDWDAMAEMMADNISETIVVAL